LGAGPGNPAREDDVTNYRCHSDVVINKHKVTSKTSLCLRAYKKYEGLYDVLFVAASLDHKNSGLISHFTLAGVDKVSAIGFSQRFMDSIAWQ
jgi:serine protease Do